MLMDMGIDDSEMAAPGDLTVWLVGIICVIAVIRGLAAWVEEARSYSRWEFAMWTVLLISFPAVFYAVIKWKIWGFAVAFPVWFLVNAIMFRKVDQHRETKENEGSK